MNFITVVVLLENLMVQKFSPFLVAWWFLTFFHRIPPVNLIHMLTEYFHMTHVNIRVASISITLKWVSGFSNSNFMCMYSCHAWCPWFEQHNNVSSKIQITMHHIMKFALFYSKYLSPNITLSIVTSNTIKLCSFFGLRGLWAIPHQDTSLLGCDTELLVQWFPIFQK